jgi:hydroxyacylglutathione hydrolase
LSQFFKQLSPMFWTTRSKFYFTNSGIFMGEGNAYLVDPGMSLDELESIARFLVEHGVTPKRLILTHCHWDHLLGPVHFPEVRITAQANYMRVLNSGRAGYVQRQVSQWETKYAVPRAKPFRVPVPDDTFHDVEMLTEGDIDLRLQHAPGHTDDLIVVYHSKHAILWASDMLSDIEIPFVHHSVDAYQNTLSMLAEWDVRILVPGHGNCTTEAKEIQSRISEDSVYLRELKDRIMLAVSEGKTLDETVELCNDMHFRNPDENAGPHLLNIENGYIEFGGKTDQEEIGWKQLGLESI